MIKKLHMVAKDWGKEEWFANNDKEDYCGKILTILENQATSMHYHADKHETFYVLEGTLAVEWIDTKEGTVNTSVLGQGGVMEMPRSYRLPAWPCNRSAVSTNPEPNLHIHGLVDFSLRRPDAARGLGSSSPLRPSLPEAALPPHGQQRPTCWTRERCKEYRAKTPTAHGVLSRTVQWR